MKKNTRVLRKRADIGKLIEFIAPLSQNDLEKYPISVTIEDHKKKRSNDQNALIHKWFAIMAKSTGHTEDDIKEDMITKFAPKVESKMYPGEYRSMRTHEMNTLQMTEFIARIYQLACEFNIMLPHPDDQGRDYGKE